MSEPASFLSHGVRCAADLHRPAGPAGEARACVVMGHGFSATKEDGLPAFADAFARAGLVALRFDYRGFGDSGGEPRQVIDVAAQLDDYRAAIAHARALPGVDPERIVVWGSSFSGGHAILLAAEDHRVAAVIAQAPFTDGVASLRAATGGNAGALTRHALRDLRRARRGRPPHLVPATGAPGTLAVMSTPDAEAGFASIVAPGSRWRNAVAARIVLQLPFHRPVTQAHRVAAPLLVTVAAHDAITPPTPALDAAAAAPRGESVTYLCGHFDVYTGAGLERSLADQVAFLQRHGLTAA